MQAGDVGFEIIGQALGDRLLTRTGLGFRDVLDIDKDVDIDRTRVALTGHEAVIYTTKRSTPTAPRLRVILPLVAPVLARDWPGTYRQIVATLALPGLDACAEKLSQPFLAPPGGGNEDGHFERLAGEWLDPAPYIAAARQIEYDALPTATAYAIATNGGAPVDETDEDTVTKSDKRKALSRQRRLSEPTRSVAEIKLEMASMSSPPAGTLQARFRTNDARHHEAIKLQAIGEGLQVQRLEKLARYETHLDRKFERTLAMLVKLKELRAGR